jgi:outer membrane protein OmpA-like peptidoglycan-associated protein
MPRWVFAFVLFWGGVALAALAQTPPILKHPETVVPRLLSELNSPFREANPTISPDGRHLFFMSGRGGQAWSGQGGYRFQGREEWDGDIWQSTRQAGQWQPPQPLGRGVNSAQGEDEPSISPDGRQVYFQSWRTGWERNGGPYYQARLAGTNWGQASGLGGGINQFFRAKGFATDGMAVSPDGAFFLVAAGPDYDGNLNLFLSKKQADGTWSYPRPLQVNTRQDERSVFIAGDSRTIYFASSGHGGAGGLDLFKGELQPDGQLTNLMNLGAPFNTPQDDYGLIIQANGEMAFFVRDGDLYEVDLQYADPRIRPGATLLIGGQVRTTSGEPLSADIQLRDLTTDKVLFRTRSNSRTGTFAIAIPYRTGPLQLLAQQASYQSDEAVISQERILKNPEIQQDLTLEKALPPPPQISQASSPTPPDLTEPFVLLFDHNSAKVLPKYAGILQGLAQLQRKYPNIQLALSGHTDADGADHYNMELSRQRVMAVARCLMLEGADEAQLFWDFCGENQPISTNEIEAGKAENRRVEIRIIRKEFR